MAINKSDLFSSLPHLLVQSGCGDAVQLRQLCIEKDFVTAQYQDRARDLLDRK